MKEKFQPLSWDHRGKLLQKISKVQPSDLLEMHLKGHNEFNTLIFFTYRFATTVKTDRLVLCMYVD